MVIATPLFTLEGRHCASDYYLKGSAWVTNQWVKEIKIIHTILRGILLESEPNTSQCQRLVLLAVVAFVLLSTILPSN